jgi:hypothetical protein
MTLQRGDSGWGSNQSAPQKLLHLVGCREAKARADLPKHPGTAKRSEGSDHCTKSPHFSTAASAGPHGITGTEEVEFFGDPSISLSE